MNGYVSYIICTEYDFPKPKIFNDKKTPKTKKKREMLRATILAVLRANEGLFLPPETWAVLSAVSNPRVLDQRARASGLPAWHCPSQPTTPTRLDFFQFLRMAGLDGDSRIYEPRLRSVRTY